VYLVRVENHNPLPKRSMNVIDVSITGHAESEVQVSSVGRGHFTPVLN
jgi:hypothetical protein